MHKICENTGIFLTGIFPYMDKIVNSVFIRENAGQRKPESSLILHGVTQFMRIQVLSNTDFIT